jgi:hypothetical protein
MTLLARVRALTAGPWTPGRITSAAYIAVVTASSIFVFGDDLKWYLASWAATLPAGFGMPQVLFFASLLGPLAYVAIPVLYAAAATANVLLARWLLGGARRCFLACISA